MTKKDNITPLLIPVADFPLDAKHFEHLAKKLDDTYRCYEQKLKQIYSQDEEK